MATPILNTSVLENFSILFVIIFLFSIIYGLLELVKIFGENKKNLHAIIALAVTIIAVMTPDLLRMIKMILPWVALMILFFFFLFAIPLFMGLKRDEILVFMGGKKKLGAVGWVLGAMIFLIVYSLSSLYGERLLKGDLEGGNASINVTGQSEFKTNILKTLTHPAILGLFVLLLISMLTINYLTKD